MIRGLLSENCAGFTPQAAARGYIHTHVIPDEVLYIHWWYSGVLNWAGPHQSINSLAAWQKMWKISLVPKDWRILLHIQDISSSARHTTVISLVDSKLNVSFQFLIQNRHIVVRQNHSLFVTAPHLACCRRRLSWLQFLVGCKRKIPNHHTC